MAETIFTKIINKEIPAEILYEDDMALAFKDINPQAPTHVLIIPKQHIATINEITQDNAEVIGQSTVVATKIAQDLNLSDDGYRLVYNVNQQGGQEVYHIHMHLLAGRQMTWPPG